MANIPSYVAMRNTKVSATQLRGEVATHFKVIPALAGRAADPLRPHPCRQEPAISLVAVQPRSNRLTGVHLMGVYLTGVHLTGVYLMGVHFIGVYLLGVHLTGVHLMGIHFIRMHLIGVHLTGMCPMGVYLVPDTNYLRAFPRQ